MDFGYTQEQNQLRKSIRDFAEIEIQPHVMEWDETQHFPIDVFKSLGRLGVLGAVFPEELGGAGYSYVDYSIIMEELARVDPSIALSAAAHISLCTNHIFLAGNREQHEKYIPKLASGEWIGCWSLTEPEAGSDAGGTRTKATLEGDCWVLNGGKTFTTNAHVADVCVAMAVTDRAASSHGISAFILEKSTPGFTVGKKENKLGMRCSPTGEVLFRDCRLPESQLCGKRGEGFVDSLRILDGGRISIAALSVGLAQGAYEAALKYSKHRKQFGRFISEFQAIQYKLADMATEIDAARLLTQRAAWLKDQGKSVNKESAMAKLYSSEIAVRAADNALQIHGGYGFIKDYPVEKFYRDVKLCTIGEGTSEIQRMVIARQLLKKRVLGTLIDLAEKILSGDIRALARAATLIENRHPESEALLRDLFPRTGRAMIVGITGSPGAGKSTLVDHLTRVLRAEGKTVGVIAVDPTSPYSGGAILGDRIRMQQHHADSGVFIRSMATRGWLGGLAAATTEMTMLLDAAGFDVVLVETVGVGQDEVEIARLADVAIVVLVPGMGDDVQAIKAGIMEIADVFVINKADLPGAEKLERELKGNLSLAHRSDGWSPRIVRTVANEGTGIAEVLTSAREFHARGMSRSRSAEIWAVRLREMLRERLIDRLPSQEFSAAGREVAEKRRDPYSILHDWSRYCMTGSSGFKIDHLGIAVRSLDEALKFYRDQLGLSVAARERVEHEKVSVAMLPLGEPRIELLEPLEADSVIGKFLEKRGEGLHHVAIRVPDLRALIDRLKASGARLLNEPREGAGGHVYVFVHPSSTGGVLLELIQE